MVAKASRSLYGDPPPFVMMEGHKMLNYVTNAMGWEKPTGLQRAWEAYCEVMNLEIVGTSVVTNMEYNASTVKETTSGGKWTKEFKTELINLRARRS